MVTQRDMKDPISSHIVHANISKVDKRIDNSISNTFPILFAAKLFIKWSNVEEKVII